MDFISIPGDGLGNLVAHIVTNYLAHHYTICVFWHLDNFDYLINSFIKNSPINNPNWAVNIDEYPTFHLYKFAQSDDRDKIVLNAVDSGCQAFIISMDTSEDFMNAYSGVTHSFFQRYPKNHMVFVPTINTKPNDTNLVLNHPIAVDVPDLIIITPQYNISEKYDLISTKFVGRYNNTAPILLDTYDCSTESFINGNNSLFPNKLLNLEGREIKITLLEYTPFTVWTLTEPGLGNANYLHSNEEKNIYIDGSEAMPFVQFCKKFNCTLVVWPSDDEFWPKKHFSLITVTKTSISLFFRCNNQITTKCATRGGGSFTNGSGYGLLGAIATRKVEIGVSALYHWPEAYRDMDLTNILVRASTVILAPKPLLLPQWRLPALPFSRYLWLAVFASFVLTVISLIFVDYFVDLSLIQNIPANRINLENLVLEVSAVLLGQSSNRTVIRIPEMVIMGCMLLISMIIDSAYTGGLASFMAIPSYEEPIDTLHQLAERGWEWGGVGDPWTYSIRLAKQPDVVRLLELFKPLTVEQMREHVSTRDYSYIVEVSQNNHFNIPEYIDQNAMNYLRLMRDFLYYDYTTAFAYKTWPFLETLNPLLTIIYEAGLPRIWELKVALEYMDNNLQLRVANSRTAQEDDDQGPEPLNTAQLLSAFGLLLLGHLIGFLVLLGEILVELKKKRTIVN